MNRHLVQIGAVTTVLLLVVVLPRIDPASPGFVPRRVDAQVVTPLTVMSGLQLPSGVRYSVSLSKSLDQVLEDVRVEVTLPADAAAAMPYVTSGYTTFEGQSGRTLRWTAARFPAGDYPDPFTFVLPAQPSGQFDVHASWGGVVAGEVQFHGRPSVLEADGTAATVDIGPDGTAGRFLALGTSGLFAGADADAVPSLSTVRVQPLGNQANPPADLSDLWWCAIVEVDGLTDASLTLVVPLRQPLPPFAWLTLFQQQPDGGWMQLTDQGLVTFDGQYVQVVSHGGTLAAGAPASARPQLASTPGSGTSAQQTTPRFATPTTPTSVRVSNFGGVAALGQNGGKEFGFGGGLNPFVDQPARPPWDSGVSGVVPAGGARGMAVPPPNASGFASVATLIGGSPADSNLTSAPLTELRRLAGQVSFVLLANGTEVDALEPEKALGVGSAFKLAVLSAVQNRVQSGRSAWSDVVPLAPEWKSMPDSVLLGWPDGAPITLDTLATLMMSRSDNTAADALISIVGRDVLEQISPRNRPFLTTRETFILKETDNHDLLVRYLGGSIDEKRAALMEAGRRSLPSETQYRWNPLGRQVEYEFSTRELCQLMSDTAGLPLASVNPGLADPGDWKRAAFKGGDEPGVLNGTMLLASRTGSTYCVSATWNGEAPLDKFRFWRILSDEISSLKE